MDQPTLPEEKEIIYNLVSLFESWKVGVFRRLGVEWVDEPPPIKKAKEYLLR